ncbi:chromosome segregation protein SMC [Sphingobacterium sp. SRCM116780]|uniref:chromosome segregation protein SMC n=1 Tax=Sphingobacterium sp. SRCM116780 TaxID=2907623 RepID=UPI001F3A6EC8|nr:chromosome segregation protein SMC [Sphingobacterium sp. SRCM116780]UIR57177.1 chromosome segregation protein SMC [Sphingobacterium sp. SRCM116780]
MQLMKLEIKGFKSFGDKITINFNEGVTAIVGPNGCGKSNVVDAIRWVLGEQSTRMLRSEKMENIIFNGTKNRKAANLAEVSLTFDNNKNVLPTAFTTVTVTRKLFRNGDSEYRLNDVKCRLKDITDLFLDTGVGADSYSIIELRMIDEIINNKENSRRNLFEEASGISKYKVRKKQTLNKLRDTEADLSRVDDLLFEITKNLKSLESQAKKAEKYTQLKDEYRQSSVNLAYYRIGDFSTELEALQTQESTLQKQTTAAQASINQAEIELKQIREDNLEQEKNVSIQQKATQEFVNKIRNYESEKKVKNEQLKNLQDKETRLSFEINNDNQQLNHVLYTIKRLHEELYHEQQQLDNLQANLEKDKAEVEELRGQQQSAKGKLDTFSKKSTELQDKIHKLEKEIAVLHIQKEALQQEAVRADTDTESKEIELNQFNISVAELEGRVETQQQQYETALQMEDELQLQIQTSATNITTYKDELSKESRLVDAKQNEYNLTKSLIDNLEGFPESIRFLKKNAGWKKQPPLFSDVLFCQEDYRVAIENYLESIMNHYVVDTQQDAVQAINLLSDAARGRANFFILDAIQLIAQLPSPADEFLMPALDVITVDEKFKVLCQLLLQNVYILKKEREQELHLALPQGDLIILQKNGKFSKSKLGLSGGSVGLFEGKRIGRAKNIEVLAKEIKALNQDISKLQDKITTESGRLQALQSNSQKQMIDELRFQLNRLNNELISVKTKQEQYQTFILNTQNRKRDIQDKIITIENDLLTFEPQIQDFKNERRQYIDDLQQQQDRFNEISEILTDKSATYNQENISYHQQQNKVSNIHKDLEFRETQKEDFEARVERNTKDLEEVQLSLKNTAQFVDVEDEDLVEMYTQKDALEKGLEDLEKNYYGVRKQINELEEQITQHRRSKEQDDVLISAIKDKKTALQLDLNSLKERLSVEFNIELKDLLEQEEIPVIAEDQDTLTAKCNRLKKQLNEYGSINLMAKEAFDEMNERYNFITSEKADLLEAKGSLLATIKEIDDTAEVQFMFTFNSVRDNFIKVFRSLFNEEDSCDLILTDPSKPLDSDIDIVARPKGKRPLSINQLSGGEKTLTSTALLFSLYLSKPAPFCIFDEVDAPLDDTNIDKFNNIIRDFSKNSQFIVVSHNKKTIASTDIIYGVTMVEQGVSRVVAVDLRDVA